MTAVAVLLLQKQIVSRIVGLFPVSVSKRIQKDLELLFIIITHLNAHQHTTLISPMITVMEKADIPALTNAR